MIILKFILSILIVVCATKLGIEISKKKFPNHKFLYFQVRQKLRLNISDEKGSI